MVTNTMPFRENVEHNWMIVEAQRNRHYAYPSNSYLSSLCRLTIDKLMTFNPHTRPSIKQCCYLGWFQTAFAVINHQKPAAQKSRMAKHYYNM